MIMTDVDRTSDFDDVIELVPDLDASALDVKLRKADRRTEVGHRELAFYLAEMHDRGLFQMLGYASAIEYACKKLEMGRRNAHDLIAVGRALNELRLVDEAFCAGKLRWSRVRLLVRIAVPETERQWVERALALGWTEFDREVATSEKGRPPRQDRKGIPKVRIVVRGRLERLAYETWELAKKKLEAERGETMSDSDTMAFAGSLILSMRPDGTVVGRERSSDSNFRVVMQQCPSCESRTLQTPEGAAEVTESEAEMLACDAKTPDSMRRKVLVRDGLFCRSCRSRQDLNAHHIVWRSKGGPTRPSNLITLCARCHGLVHENLLVVWGRAPNSVRFADRHGKALDQAGAITGLFLRNLRIEAALAARAADGAAASGGGSCCSNPPSLPAVTFGSIPSRFDLSWLTRHQHLFTFHEGSGEMRFKPGEPSVQPLESEAATMAEPAGSDLANRPARLADVVGQEAAVHTLTVAAKAAKKRDAAVDHVLLLGPAGLGKTTLAQVVAHEIGTRLHLGSGALIQDPGVLIRLLTGIRDKDVLFIDELHALPKRVMESLYEAMEDRRISLTVTDGHASKAVRIDLPSFTLVGATTEIGRLPEALVSRFSIREHLARYSGPHLSAIVVRTAVHSGVPIDDDAAAKVASVSRGVPREAIGLFRRIRDEALAADQDRIDSAAVDRSLAAAGIDAQGLHPIERQALEALRLHGRPMGLSRWAASAGLPVSTLRQLCEPELLRQGLITVTPRGRMACAQLCTGTSSAQLCTPDRPPLRAVAREGGPEQVLYADLPPLAFEDMVCRDGTGGRRR